MYQCNFLEPKFDPVIFVHYLLSRLLTSRFSSVQAVSCSISDCCGRFSVSLSLVCYSRLCITILEVWAKRLKWVRFRPLLWKNDHKRIFIGTPISLTPRYLCIIILPSPILTGSGHNWKYVRRSRQLWFKGCILKILQFLTGWFVLLYS